MAVAADGRFQGSVSGGCIEGEVIMEAEDILASGQPKTLTFGVADETAWRVGLPCGGKVQVFVERIDGGGRRRGSARSRCCRRREPPRPGGATRSSRMGASEVFEREDDNLPDDIAERFRTAKSQLREERRRVTVFLHALVPPARILIIGATHIGQVLTQVARLAGYEVVVIDPRTAFASPERFAGVKLLTEWPQDVLPKVGLDPYTAVVALAHVGHIDDEALKLAVKSECLYIGALGSSRNHAKRVERLKAAGITEAQIARIKAPIGLDIGAQSPAEVAHCGHGRDRTRGQGRQTQVGP